MNVRIPPPQLPTTGPDVTLECEQAIDGAVRELVDQAITAGWSPEAAFEAIKHATERQAAAYHEDSDPADDPVEASPTDRLLASALLVVVDEDRDLQRQRGQRTPRRAAAMAEGGFT